MITNPKQWSTIKRFWYQNRSVVFPSIQPVTNDVCVQAPALCLCNIVSSRSFHLEAAAVGGFEHLWSNVRWIKLISVVPATSYRWYNESSWNFWSYFQSYVSNFADISIHMPSLRRAFDVWFPVSFEMDHDYNNTSVFLSLADSPQLQERKLRALRTVYPSGCVMIW